MERKSRRSCPPPLPPKCDALPLLQFLSHCFRLWSRDHPADSPGSNPGGVCITPFYLYKKKKKKNDGLKNVLRKKKMYFFINKVFKTTLVPWLPLVTQELGPSPRLLGRGRVQLD